MGMMDDSATSPSLADFSSIRSPTDEPTRAGLWAVLLCSIFVWAPTVYPGYWQTLDGFAPLFNAAKLNSIANVATWPDVWRGSSWGAYLLAQPFLIVGLEPVVAVRSAFALAILLGGLGVYSWLHPRLGDRSAGLAGVIYMLMPTLLATIYVRGSMTDAFVLALLPLTLAGLTIYVEQRSIVAAAVTVVAILWLWRTQAGLAVLVSILLVLYAVLVERSWLATLIVIVTSVVALISLTPLLGILAPPTAIFADHFVDLFQLLRPAWQVAPSIAGWQDEFPFQVGMVVFAFAVVAGWELVVLRPRLSAATHRLLIFCAVGAMLLTVFSLGVSEPLWRVSGAGRLLTYPWQVGLLAAPLLACLAGSLPAVIPALRQPAYWIGTVTLVVIASSPFLVPVFTQVSPPPQPLAVFGDNQLIVLSADLLEQDQPHQATLTVTWQVLQPLDFDDNLFLQAVTQDGSPQVVAQIDAQPLEGRPATGWQAGEIFTASYTLSLPDTPADTTGSPLEYHFGLYNWSNGVRRVVDGGLTDKMVFYGE